MPVPSVPVQRITVDSPDGLFLLGFDLIVAFSPADWATDSRRGYIGQVSSESEGVARFVGSTLRICHRYMPESGAQGLILPV